MDRTSLRLGLAAALGSALLLGGAFFFQAIGYAPCAMCLWQRYPHAVAITLGVILLVVGRGRAILAAGGVAAAATAVLGFYHTGVERGWWEGPSTCTGDGGSLTGMTGADLLSFDDAAPLVMCDEVVWEFLGLSMASWNGILSIALAGIWFLALARSLRSLPQRRQAATVR
ncbi:MAG: disulfide bond formation protein B [Shimia sp.]